MKHKHERNALREELKQIAQLKRDVQGVKAERDAIKLQRESELKMISAKVVQAPKETVPYTPTFIKNSVYGLHRSIEALKGEVADLKKQAKAYQKQGFWGRVFGLTPKAEYDRLWDKPSRPITPSPESE